MSEPKQKRVIAKSKEAMNKAQKAFSNFEIVTLALYLLGGEAAYVDIEDVAVRANALAPGRFAWRKYTDQINISYIGSALSDARKPKNGALVFGSVQGGWMLTEEGLSFASQRIDDLQNVDLSRKAQTAEQRNWERKERARLLSDEALDKFQKKGSKGVSRQEAEAFFRINDYVVGQARERKIVRLLNAFGDDTEIGPVVRALAEKIRGKSTEPVGQDEGEEVNDQVC